MSPAEKALLNLARKLLGIGRKDPVTVVLARGPVQLLTSAPEVPTELPPLPPGATNLKDLLRHFLTERTQSLKTLARLCRRKPNTHFRKTLMQMVECDPPQARKVTGGFRKA